jgi:hypothetical protein
LRGFSENEIRGLQKARCQVSASLSWTASWTAIAG